MTIKGPLLWIDADGFIVRRPELFQDPPFDFAISGRHPKPPNRWVNAVGRGRIELPRNWPVDEPPIFFNSGTIYFGDTQAARALIYHWAELAREDPKAWDQWTLQQAWADMRARPGPCELRTQWLSTEYCDIKGRTRSPIIRHNLASTEMKVTRG